MTTSIIPESYSHVIYFQPSFEMAVKKDLTSLKHIPYVKLALDFPWEKVFASIEQDYLKARYLFYKSNPKVPQDELFPGFTYETDIAHKVALVCGVKSELPISRSVFKGNDHDATTLTDTLEQVKKDLPKEWVDSIQYVSADGIYQSEKNQEQTKAILQAKLLAPINPRKIKEQILDVRGMTKLDKYGVPHCISEHHLVLKGYDETKGQYVWTCPVFNPKYKVEGLTCSSACHVQCCSGAKTGRTVRIDSSLTPQIDKEFPQHLRSFKIKYAERTAIERVIGQAKEGFSMRRVHKRGRQAVEAHVDRCIMIAHALAYVSVQETGRLSRAWTKNAA